MAGTIRCPLNEMPSSLSPSGCGLTRTIRKNEYLSSNSTGRRDILETALCRHNPAVDHEDHSAVAVNFAISYEYDRVRPSSEQGLKELEAIFSFILSRCRASAFRLWYDKIYIRDRDAHHMQPDVQTWIHHGLTPYECFPVFVLGGYSTINSIRGWVQCELASARLHDGYFYVKDSGHVSYIEGQDIGWNNNAGRSEAREIYGLLANGQLEVRHQREKVATMGRMKQLSG